MTQNTTHALVLAAFLTGLLIFPDIAMAQTALFDSGTNFLTALQNLLSNTWARIIGIIAVCCCGILWMLGRMQWGVAASVIGGLILIFGSAAIVDSVAASL
jgi:type IV secretion system protein VirB2